MTPPSKRHEEKARKVFALIEKELRGRRGIRQEWDQIDVEIEQEIRDANFGFIASALAQEREETLQEVVDFFSIRHPNDHDSIGGLITVRFARDLVASLLKEKKE